MEERVQQVKAFYDIDAQHEWDRLDRHPAEFALTKHFIERYVKPGDSVLDVGGGPGRYALHFAAMGCNVRLLDLSAGNVAFARAKAAELGLQLDARAGDARVVDTLVDGLYDHVFLMGPLYHLFTEADRAAAVSACLRLLKPGGLLYVSFISSYAGIIYYMKYSPEMLQANPIEEEYAQYFIDDEPFNGEGFTQMYMIRQRDVLPFMAGFPLEKLHYFSQEGILAPCELTFMQQPPEVMEKWLTLSEQVCEREDLLSYAEHLMYIGRKTE